MADLRRAELSQEQARRFCCNLLKSGSNWVGRKGNTVPTYLRRGSAVALAALSLTLFTATSSQASHTSRPGPTVPPTTVVPTTTAPTTTVPTIGLAAPTNLRLLATTGYFAPTPTMVWVTWNPVLVGVTSYTVFLNGVNRGTDTCSGGPYCYGESFNSAGFRNLTPGTTYTVTVRANGNGTISPISAPFVFTTPLV